MIALAYVVILGMILMIVLFMAFVILEVWGDVKGAPFVPSGNRDIAKLLEVVKIKPNARVVELGCGSGRFLRAAARKYQIYGVGVDVNWMLIMWAKINAWMGNLKQIDFECRDMFDINLSGADVIYMFLLPRSLEKLNHKLQKETRKGVLVISHGFELAGWNKRLVTRIHNHMFDTFVYQV